MAIWPFNRTKNQSAGMPQEVQDYYQAEKREKVGIAGLLALGTLLVTIVVAMGFFFGGRWVYRTVFKDDKKPVTTAQTENTQDQTENTENQDNTSEETPAATPTPAPATTPTPAPVAASNPKPAATPAKSDLPNTGPADTLAIVVGTVLVSSTVFYIKRRPQEA